MRSAFEQAIRLNFPGPFNAGLRCKIRASREPADVRMLAHTVALTVSGRLGLEDCAQELERQMAQFPAGDAHA